MHRRPDHISGKRPLLTCAARSSLKPRCFAGPLARNSDNFLESGVSFHWAGDGAPPVHFHGSLLTRFQGRQPRAEVPEAV